MKRYNIVNNAMVLQIFNIMRRIFPSNVRSSHFGPEKFEYTLFITVTTRSGDQTHADLNPTP